MEVSIMHHVCAVLGLLWLLSRFDCCYPLAYFVAFIYLYLVHERYVMRLRKLLQCEERKQANQRRVLSDSETVRWLNYAVEKMWPVCMEEIVSQKFLLPIIPWFLEKYKPWTAKEAVVQQLYMGRNPPVFTEMRVLRQTTDDDHLVLELGMNFLTADDMSAILSVKLRRRLGFGIWAKLHMTGMHVEGKVLVGVKFVRRWPFLGRVRVCFVEPPYFQMTVKPLSTHGLDVTELPGIAGWLDKLLGIAFEQTLVEPNMLVVDVEKFASPSDDWFSVDEKVPLAYAKVEVIEASEMKPSDMNGLADPYVKGQLGLYRFKTKTQWKTLTPKWHEEFKIPIWTWKSQNELAIEVCDKDHFIDDQLGDCSVSISDLRDGQRHDMWLPLQKIKMGRLHLAITVIEDNGKEANMPYEDMLNKDYSENSFPSVAAGPGSIKSLPTEKYDEVADKFEPVDVEGQDKTGIWVHQPGSSISQAWEPRKGKNRLADNKIHSKPKPNDSGGSPTALGSFHNYDSSADEDKDGTKLLQLHSLKRGFLKFSSIFQRSPKDDDQSAREVDPSPHANIKSVNASKIGVKLIIEDSHCEPVNEDPVAEGSSSDCGSGGSESPTKTKMRDKAKSFLRHAGRSARSLKQRVLSPKASFRSDHSEITGTDREISVNSDCSDNESLRSLVHDPAASSHVNPTEPAVLTGLDLPNDPVSKVCSEALEKQQKNCNLEE